MANGRGWISSMAGKRGSILIGLITTMVIFAVIGAAMLSLFSISSFSQIGGSSAMRAYYLAESGYRYASGEYSNAGGESAKNDMLEALNNTSYTLSGDDGKFHLDIYPYYYVATADHAAGSTTLNTKIPGAGGSPPGLTIPSSGRLKIESDYYNYSAFVQDGQNVTFTMSQPISSVQEGETILPVAISSSLSQSVTKGGNLSIQAGTADAFPLRNGSFVVNSHSYSYETLDLANNQLIGIHDPDDPNMSSFTVGSDTDIFLLKFIKLYSTGIFGQGSSIEANREIVYNVPLSTAYKAEFHETFDDKSKWGSLKGTHEIQAIGGDSALRVTGTVPQPGAPKVSLIALDWASTAINLETAHEIAGNYLSYDSQVKVGFEETTPPPNGGYDPVPIPKYFAAGISFRLDSAENYYGVSYLRGSNSAAPPYDNINNNIVPVDDKLSIVLWQKTGPNESDWTWLAYKDLSQNDFFDNVESGEDGWTTSGLWHITEHRSESSSHAWYYGQEGTWNYNTGVTNSGSIETPPISLCGFSTAKLKFYSWYQTEPQAAYINSYDVKYVYILNEAGTTLRRYQIIDPAYAAPAGYKLEQVMNSWNELEIDLTPFVGQVIKVKFFFDTRDSQFNNYEGWYVDDIKVAGDYEFPVNEATLMVRLIEAASLDFTANGTTEIESGDIITQPNGAMGTVVGNPILNSGSWTVSGTATGVILLNNLPRDTDGSITVPFQAGNISVEGKGTNLATVSNPRPKDNFIRAYYADPTGCGTPDGDLLDERRLAYSRGDDIQWPPDNLDGDCHWTADKDYFTLVQWDYVNCPVEDGDVDTIERISSLCEPDAILRSSESKLLTLDTDELSDSELGLHALGHGARNVYFDDFAIQAEIRAKRTGFLPSTQQ